jgi:C4-dicarboxylate transporter DctM subunit
MLMIAFGGSKAPVLLAEKRRNRRMSGRILFRKTGRVIDVLSTIGGNASAVLVFIMALSLVFEIVTRTFFNRPSHWTLEFSIYFTISAALLGAAYAAQKGRHINVDIITCRLQPRNEKFIDFFTYLWGLVFLTLFIYSSIRLVAISRLTHALSIALQIPYYFPQSVMVIGAVLLFLQLLKITIEKGLVLIKEKKNPSPQGALAGSSFIRFANKPAVLLFLFAALVVIGGYLLAKGEGSLALMGLIFLIFVFLFSGMPIYLGLLAIASIGSFLLIPGGLRSQLGLAQAGYGALDKFELAAIPLFILGGSLLGVGKLSDRLFDVFQVFTSRIPGGLAVASILTCAAFGAMCGSGISGALTIGIVAVPAMVARGYDKRFSLGCLATAGTLAILIPPSIPMIVYASQTDTSVTALFAAGIVPGLIVTGLLSAYVILRCKKDPRYHSVQSFSREQKLHALKQGIPLLVIPVGLLGSIYTGTTTPTESAAAFVLYALVLGFVFGELTLSNLWETLRNSALVCSSLLMILLTATILNTIVARVHAVQMLTSWALSEVLPPWAVIVSMMIALIFGGMIFESAAMMIIMQPILAPIAVAMGYSAVWFGILIVINAEIAQISPPVGIVLYALHTALGERLGVRIEEIMKGALPFMVVLMFGLLIVGLFPVLSLWLPSILLK